jgi:hypothetical protein
LHLRSLFLYPKYVANYFSYYSRVLIVYSYPVHEGF